MSSWSLPPEARVDLICEGDEDIAERNWGGRLALGSSDERRAAEL
jgi:hypothetical protein